MGSVTGGELVSPQQTDHTAPITGGFHWLPSPHDGSITWDVVTCHELGFDAETGHVELWAAVLDRLAVV